jgi:hypothetical protein
MEPIRSVYGDDVRAAKVTKALQEAVCNEWVFYPTPPFFFTDYHIQRQKPNGRANYIGDLEIKWFNTPSDTPAKFPFQKLQKMLIAPPYTDDPQVFHRICFRFTDGLLLIPAFKLATIIPERTTRYDTMETDFNLLFSAYEFVEYWIEKVVND